MSKLTEIFSSLNTCKIVEDSGSAMIELRVMARPGSKKERFSKDDQGHLKIHIAAKAIDGAANKAICKILGKKLGLAQGQLEIISGAHSKHKMLRINYFFTDHKNVDYYWDKAKFFIAEL